MCKRVRTNRNSILSQAQMTTMFHLWLINGKRDYTREKERGKERQTECLEGNHAQSIFMQHSIPSLQLNTCTYVANSLKSSILNLYGRCAHKLLIQYISLRKLAGSSDTAFNKRCPNPWTWKKNRDEKEKHHPCETSIFIGCFSKGFTRDYYGMTIKKPFKRESSTRVCVVVVMSKVSRSEMMFTCCEGNLLLKDLVSSAMYSWSTCGYRQCFAHNTQWWSTVQ